MNSARLILTLPLLLSPCMLLGQGAGVNPAELLKPLQDSWPTYNGDYSAKRYSALKQVDRSNVTHLTLAWASRVSPGAGATGRGEVPASTFNLRRAARSGNTTVSRHSRAAAARAGICSPSGFALTEPRHRQNSMKVTSMPRRSSRSRHAGATPGTA